MKRINLKKFVNMFTVLIIGLAILMPSNISVKAEEVIELEVGSQGVNDTGLLPVSISSPADINIFNLTISATNDADILGIVDGICSVNYIIESNGDCNVWWEGAGPLTEDGVLFYIDTRGYSPYGYGLAPYTVNIDGDFTNTDGSDVDVVCHPGEVAGSMATQDPPYFISIYSDEMIPEIENEFSVSLSVNPFTSSGAAYAADVEIVYDTSCLTFIRNESNNLSTEVVADNEELGTIRALVSIENGLDSVEYFGILFNTIMIPKASERITYSWLDINALIGTAPSGSTYNAESYRVIVEVYNRDSSALEAKIIEAETLLSSVTVGTDVGEYSQNTYDKLEEAIRVEKTYIDHIFMNQQRTDEHVVVLQGEIDDFDPITIEKSEDINRDGVINIGDLAIIVYYYGVLPIDLEWNEAQFADLNNDGLIDISDVSMVANKILN